MCQGIKTERIGFPGFLQALGPEESSSEINDGCTTGFCPVETGPLPARGKRDCHKCFHLHPAPPPPTQTVTLNGGCVGAGRVEGDSEWAGASGQWSGGASGETRAERPYLPVRFLTCEIGVHVPAWQVWGSPGRCGDRVKQQAWQRLPGGLT